MSADNGAADRPPWEALEFAPAGPYAEPSVEGAHPLQRQAAPRTPPAQLAAGPSPAPFQGSIQQRSLAPMNYPQLQPPTAMGEAPSTQSHMLGAVTVFVGLGALVGMRLGGGYGAGAGMLFGGALVNAYRAIKSSMQGTPADDKEAYVSGTFALVSTGVGGYVVWKLMSGDTPLRINPSGQGCSPNGRRRCGIRPAF